MPIFEYECTSCGEIVEKLQKRTDPPIVDCPSCGKPSLQKVVSASGFQLKGSGWYVTDFRDKGKKSENKASAKENSAPCGGEGGGCASGACALEA